MTSTPRPASSTGGNPPILRPPPATPLGATVKTLTVRQPWAALILAGIKHHETRTWTTAHRGQLAIHAGMSWAADAPCHREPSATFVADEALRRALGKHCPGDLTWPDQRGVILGEVTLDRVIETTDFHPDHLVSMPREY